jgi:hypothetical protein
MMGSIIGWFFVGLALGVIAKLVVPATLNSPPRPTVARASSGRPLP